MAPSRTRPRLRFWIGGVALVTLCAWLATWLPSSSFFRGTPELGPEPLSRPTPASAAPHAASPQVPAPLPPLDPAEVDRIFGAHPELRGDLLAWRFGSAFARARDPREALLVREELARAVSTLGYWVRDGRILEASLRLEALADAAGTPLRAALEEVAARLGVAASLLGSGAASRPGSPPGLAVPPAPPWQRGSLVRYRSGSEVRSGRVEKSASGKLTLRTQGLEGVVFPELAERDVEPAAPSAPFALHAASAALAEGRLREAALWTACGEGLADGAREPFVRLRRQLEAAAK